MTPDNLTEAKEHLRRYRIGADGPAASQCDAALDTVLDALEAVGKENERLRAVVGSPETLVETFRAAENDAGVSEPALSPISQELQRQVERAEKEAVKYAEQRRDMEAERDEALNDYMADHQHLLTTQHQLRQAERTMRALRSAAQEVRETLGQITRPGVYEHEQSCVDALNKLRELTNESDGFPGDTTASDWSDKEWWFWLTEDHGREGIARTPKQRGPSGRAVSPGYIRWRFCEDHKDWEISRRRITSKRALEWLHGR